MSEHVVCHRTTRYYAHYRLAGDVLPRELGEPDVSVLGAGSEAGRHLGCGAKIRLS